MPKAKGQAYTFGDPTGKPTIRRLFVDHYTEHDFEMERIHNEACAKVSKQRNQLLEEAGWKPFQAPFYWGRREYHFGYFIPETRKRVPPKIAFAMQEDRQPGWKKCLPPWPDYPQGWEPPTTECHLPKYELVKVEPMKVPAFNLLNLDYTYGDGSHQAMMDRIRKHFMAIEGVRSAGWGTKRDPTDERAVKCVHVTLEHERFRENIPDTWEDLPVCIRVKSKAQEEAEHRDRRAQRRAYLDECNYWLRKAEEFGE